MVTAGARVRDSTWPLRAPGPTRRGPAGGPRLRQTTEAGASAVSPSGEPAARYRDQSQRK